MYIVVILLGTSVGAATSAEAFLKVDTLKIVVLGLIAFAFGTAGGVLLGKVMCKLCLLYTSVPAIIHPSAVVSPSAVIGAGSFIMQRAVVNTHTVIEHGVLVNSGAVVDHDSYVARGAHIGLGSVVKANCRIEDVYKRQHLSWPLDWNGRTGWGRRRNWQVLFW